ncbi:MAG: M56 family metallopeptidase [Isosphaeraceae bacterium]
MDTFLRAMLSNAAASSILALLVACLSRPLERRPAILHGLWLLVLVKLMTPPLYQVPIPWPVSKTTSARADLNATELRVVAVEADDLEVAAANNAISPVRTDGERTMAAPAEALASAPAPAATPIDWRRSIAAVWLSGSLVVLILTVQRTVKFHRLLRSARPATDDEREWIENLAQRIGMRRAPQIGWVRARISPLVWSVGRRPRLVLPKDLWKTLDERKRSTLVVHELAHVRRGDHLVRFLEVVVTCLYWWHPLLGWIRQSLRDAEERCCDAWVVWAFPDATRSYAETLLDALDFVHRSDPVEPLLASGLGKVPNLQRRLTMIMTGMSRRSPGLPGRLGLLAVAVALLPLGATWAQSTAGSKDDQGEPGQVRIESGDMTIVAQNARFSDGKILFRGDTQVAPRDTTIELSGPLDDVIDKLEKLIDDLKQKKIHDGDGHRVVVKSMKLDGPNGPSAETLQEVHQHVKEHLKLMHDVVPVVHQQVQIERAQQEVRALRASIETSMKKLEAAQARIRELGGEPGETPVISWAVRPHAGKVVHYVVSRPVKIVGVTPQVKTTTTTPAGERKLHEVSVEVKAEYKPDLEKQRTEKQPSRPEAAASDSRRIDQIEKHLKELQDELQRMKKSAGNGFDTRSAPRQ